MSEKSERYRFGKIRPPGRDRVHLSMPGKTVEILEKIDGSQFSFWLEDGRVLCRSRNNLVTQQTGGLFGPAWAYATTLADKLSGGHVYRAEALSKRKHNVLEYGRAPETGLVLWAVESIADGSLMPYDEMVQEADRLGLECAPLVASVTYKGVASLDPHIEGDSFLGGPREGVVGRTLDGVYCKAVATSFHEVSGNRARKRRSSDQEAVAAIADKFATVPRWSKAVQRLHENGDLSGDMSDMPKLIKGVYVDVEEEEADLIKELLFQEFRKQVLRGSVNGLAEWYRGQLP